MQMARREDGSLFVQGHARLSRVYEGPPRGVHGGWVAALFDEMLGATMALTPPPGVTAKLSVDYRHLTPIEEDLRLEAWITDERERRIQAEATCHAGETLTATASALFVRVDFKQVEARMRARRAD
jgi:acyl-coenzyme A thioesterase PaaI-like protein